LRHIGRPGEIKGFAAGEDFDSRRARSETQGPIDAFFNGVMVMDKDETIRITAWRSWTWFVALPAACDFSLIE